MTATFFIPGNPVAQGRGRIVRIGQNARIADPVKSREWKAYVKAVAAEHAPATPSSKPIYLSLRFDFMRPKSRKRDRFVVTRPDVDNLAKGIMDAMNGIFFEDDRQVASLGVLKAYTKADGAPGVYVHLSDMEQVP